VVSGAPPSQSQSEAWFEAELAAAREPLSLENLCITYRMEWHDVPPAKELRALRDVVARHPDHPDAQALAVYDRRLREGPSIERFKVWIGDDGRWRRSNLPALSRPLKEPTDTAWTPDTTWVMGRDYLTIADPRKDTTGAFNYGSLIDEFLRWVGFSWNGGLKLISELGLEPGAARDDAGRWFADATRDRFGTMRFTWTWDERSGSGLVQEMRIVSAPASTSEEGSRYVMTDWHEEPVVGRWIASRVESYRADGRLAQVFVVEGIEVADGAFIGRLTAVPAFDGTDPFRGPVAFTRVQDRRSGTDQFTTIDRSEAGTATAHSARDSGANPKGWSLDWLWIGWVSAAVIAVTIVVLRIRRSGA